MIGLVYHHADWKMNVQRFFVIYRKPVSRSIEGNTSPSLTKITSGIAGMASPDVILPIRVIHTALCVRQRLFSSFSFQ